MFLQSTHPLSPPQGPLASSSVLLAPRDQKGFLMVSSESPFCFVWNKTVKCNHKYYHHLIIISEDIFLWQRVFILKLDEIEYIIAKLFDFRPLQAM